MGRGNTNARNNKKNGAGIIPSRFQEDEMRKNDARWNFLLLTMAILFSFAICASYTAAADSTPILPHRFHGNVTFNDEPGAIGTYISAEVTGGEGNFTTVEYGRYGSQSFLGDKLLVQGNISTSAEITFYLNGFAAECYDVDTGGPWQATYPFTPDDDTNLDLRAYGLLYVIEASAGEGGFINPFGTMDVYEGQNVTFNITPDACYRILDVLVDNSSAGAVSEYTFSLIDDNHTIQASFTPLNYTIISSSSEGGSIDPSGSVEVPCGGNMTFFIDPEQCWEIDDVEVDNISVGAVSEYNFSFVDDDHTINASFSHITYTINASAGPNGNISPEGDIPVYCGEDQTFAFLPDQSYRVADVMVDGEPQGKIWEYTFQDVADNHIISVTFEEGPPEYFTAPLGTGWNLFSTPVKLETGHQYMEDIFPDPQIQNIDLILGWDGLGWFIPGYSYELKPLECVYVHTTSPATAYIYPSSSVTSPPSRGMNIGVNLVGPAPAYLNGTFPAMPVDQAFKSIEEAPGNLTGYTMIISPSLNQPGWVYVPGGTIQQVLPYKGYWIVMENPDTLYGFSTTPIC